MKEYVVRVSPYRKHVVEAETARKALVEVWNDIKDGYRFGYRNLTDFIRRAKIEE